MPSIQNESFRFHNLQFVPVQARDKTYWNYKTWPKNKRKKRKIGLGFKTNTSFKSTTHADILYHSGKQKPKLQFSSTFLFYLVYLSIFPPPWSRLVLITMTRDPPNLKHKAIQSFSLTNLTYLWTQTLCDF